MSNKTPEQQSSTKRDATTERKPYVAPVVERVALTPSEAVLANCKVPGGPCFGVLVEGS